MSRPLDREALVFQHMGLPRRLVNLLMKQGKIQTDPANDIDDWVQVATIAMFQCAEKWDPDHEGENGAASFMVYAWRRMHGAIQDQMRSSGRAVGWTRNNGRIAVINSLDAPLMIEGDGEPLTLADQLADDYDDCQALLDSIDLDVAMEALWRYNVRLANVIALHIFEDWTMQEIGELLGVSESRVSQLVTKGRRFMVDRLAA